MATAVTPAPPVVNEVAAAAAAAAAAERKRVEANKASVMNSAAVKTAKAEVDAAEAEVAAASATSKAAAAAAADAKIKFEISDSNLQQAQHVIEEHKKQITAFDTVIATPTPLIPNNIDAKIDVAAKAVAAARQAYARNTTNNTNNNGTTQKTLLADIEQKTKNLKEARQRKINASRAQAELDEKKKQAATNKNTINRALEARVGALPLLQLNKTSAEAATAAALAAAGAAARTEQAAKEKVGDAKRKLQEAVEAAAAPLAAARATRVKQARNEEAAAAAAAEKSSLIKNNTKRGFFSNPIEIQVVDAAKKGKSQLLEKLIPRLQGYTDPTKTDAPSQEYMKVVNNALFAAASGARAECVKILLDNKASFSVRDNNRDTILHAAVKSLNKPTNMSMSNLIESVKNIIKDVTARAPELFKQKNIFGVTILHLTAENPGKGNEEVLNTILELPGADKPFLNSITKSSNNSIANGKPNGKTALQLVHNMNATKKNTRGREGRYPMYNVNFKKAVALMNKGATPTIKGTNGKSQTENEAVYPALMKYYKKLNTISGETANIEKIQNVATRAAKAGVSGSVFTRNAKYYNNKATKYETNASETTNNTRKRIKLRKALVARQKEKSIRNARAREAANRMASSIKGVKTGLMGYNTGSAAAPWAAATAKRIAATRTESDAMKAVKNKLALLPPQQTFWQRIGLSRGGRRTRKH